MERHYNQIRPSPRLRSLIKSYWQVENPDDLTVRREKIIPDGYPELIFHYGDAYRININGNWHIQDPNLIAGQITKYFYLENTGTSKIFAIKFQPWALFELFEIDMSGLVDTVNTLPSKLFELLRPLRTIGVSSLSFEEKVQSVENWFLELYKHQITDTTSTGRAAAALIIQQNGSLDLKEIQTRVGISERSMERYFKSHIGLTPKFYTRIIRFSSIFKLVQQGSIDWANVVFLAGFYDQAHFIKNFKEFTGEDPSKYKFFEENMANLFLKG